MPHVQGESESQETGVVIRIENEKPSWDDIVEAQLKRRDEQIQEAQRLERERLAQIEAARKAEEARLAHEAEKKRKVAQRASKRPIIRQTSSNMFSWGSCVWFVAQKRAVGNWGNANQWLANARADGFATGSVPQVGAIAWTGRGALGHVAYIIAVNGNQVTVQDSNYAGLGVITTRVTSASEWQYIY